MEASHVTLHGEDAGGFAEAFVDAKATEKKRSINKRGVRDIHRFAGDGVTQVAYERGAAHESSWVMVSLLVQDLDEESCSVTVLVGGGGEGPFKLEEITIRRLLRGETAVGQAGRFVTVLDDVRDVAESLDLAVETRWESDTEENLLRNLERKVFES